jgi:hypothetical protein
MRAPDASPAFVDIGTLLMELFGADPRKWLFLCCEAMEAYVTSMFKRTESTVPFEALLINAFGVDEEKKNGTFAEQIEGRADAETPRRDIHPRQLKMLPNEGVTAGGQTVWPWSRRKDTEEMAEKNEENRPEGPFSGTRSLDFGEKKSRKSSSRRGGANCNGIKLNTFSWSGPRGVAGCIEAHACAWHANQPVLSSSVFLQ